MKSTILAGIHTGFINTRWHVFIPSGKEGLKYNVMEWKELIPLVLSQFGGPAGIVIVVLLLAVCLTVSYTVKWQERRYQDIIKERDFFRDEMMKALKIRNRYPLDSGIEDEPHALPEPSNKKN